MGFISFVGHIKTGRLAEQSEVTKVGSHAVTGSWRQLSVHEGWSYFHAPARERGCRRNRYKCLIYNLWEKLCNKSSRQHLEQWMIGSPHENGVLKSASCFCIFIYCLFSIKRSNEACLAVVRNLSLQCQTNVPEGKRLMALSAVSADAVVDFSMHFMT